MKRIIFTVLSCFLIIIVLNGCQQQGNEGKPQNEVDTSGNAAKDEDIRKYIWNQLTKESKNSIEGTWKNGNVQKKILKRSMADIKDDTYFEKEVYMVSFPSTNNPTIGPVIVYADIETHKIIGYGYRD